MKSIHLQEVNLIEGRAELQPLAQKLAGERRLAVDTESNSLYAFRERVCLIQFSTASEDYLVDPLAIGDLRALGVVFADPRIEKIFHAAEYDLICLRRDFHFEVVNIFDTMLAARILGRVEVGLGSLLEAEFEVQLTKRYQRANWGQRPLPEHLLDYARLDTHYLIALRNRLAAELEERGLMVLAQEDFRRLTTNTPAANGELPGNDRPADCWRISGAHDLDPQRAAVLKELCEYRIELARQLDRPLFKVINDHTLMAIAAEAPQSLDELRRLPGMSNGQVRRYGLELLRQVQRGLAAEPLYPPRAPRPNAGYTDRLEALRIFRKQAAQQMGVPSDVVLPRDLMQMLAQKNPRDRAELAQVMQSSPYRLERFGRQLLETLHGH